MVQSLGVAALVFAGLQLRDVRARRGENVESTDDDGINAGFEVKARRVELLQLGGEFTAHKATTWVIEGQFAPWSPWSLLVLPRCSGGSDHVRSSAEWSACRPDSPRRTAARGTALRARSRRTG